MTEYTRIAKGAGRGIRCFHSQEVPTSKITDANATKPTEFIALLQASLCLVECKSVLVIQH